MGKAASAPKKARGIEALVVAWKALHLVFSPLERRIKAARHAVTEAIIAAGGKPAITSVGTIALHTKQVTDWKGMAHAALSPATIAELQPKFTKTSEPWVQALHGWSDEADEAKGQS